jgi:hypothetical protein
VNQRPARPDIERLDLGLAARLRQAALEVTRRPALGVGAGRPAPVLDARLDVSEGVHGGRQYALGLVRVRPLPAQWHLNKPGPSLGHILVAIGGVLLLGFLFLSWFGASGGFSGDDETASAWQAFSVADIALCVLAVLLVVLAVLDLTGATRGIGWLGPRLLTAFAGAAVVIALVLMLEFTSGDLGEVIEVRAGAILSVIAALLAYAGAHLVARPDLVANLSAQRAGASPATPAPPSPAAPSPSPPAPAGGAQQLAAAGWYADPRGERRLRYWDGQRWTDDVAD